MISNFGCALLVPVCYKYFNLNEELATIVNSNSKKVSHYIITCYLPSGMFVIVSWISFLIPPDIVPGRKVEDQVESRLH